MFLAGFAELRWTGWRGRPVLGVGVCGLCLCMAACGTTSRTGVRSASEGRPWSGTLIRGEALEDRGPGFERVRPGDPARWGIAPLVASLRAAATEVASRYPGGDPLRIGDLSLGAGGMHPRHRSHRTGRDADLLFFALDARGHRRPAPAWTAYDSAGMSRPRGAGKAQGEELYFFDDARNWALVRGLLARSDLPLQWLFCAAHIKARLLRYAAQHEPDPALIVRATVVLHQPSKGNSHDDHFHVRLACSARQRALGCVESGPMWAWWRPRHERPPHAPVTLDDETLVALLLRTPEQLVAGLVQAGGLASPGN